MDITYRWEPGYRRIVLDNGKPPFAFLPERQDLVNHSPDGFNCGYGGRGPAQLALALCAHALGDDARVKRVYQIFKWKVVANRSPNAPWSITWEEIMCHVNEIERHLEDERA